ncbi:MAG: hypothetical protein QG614_182 [Patescibacteria group bacterium]|nr:hypothetical protein [Patescibacteria group bacterium]
MNPKRQDKYKAIWMSHSSLQDYEKCPRLYYLHNIYKDKKTGRKINIASPYTTLGIAVHNVLEALVNYKTEDRIKQDLLANYEKEWSKFSSSISGFDNEEQEKEFKERGRRMLQNVMSNYRVLSLKTIPLSSYYDGDMLPNYYISEEENIILCGNIDWIEYADASKSLNVIDFKTGKNEEKEDSLQLPIYKLLLTNLQNKWKVNNGYYWYLDNDSFVEKELPESLLKNTKTKIIKTGTEIRDKRFVWNESRGAWENVTEVEKNFTCSNGEYCDCKKYEKILKGEATYLGIDMYGKDSYKI